MSSHSQGTQVEVDSVRERGDPVGRVEGVPGEDRGERERSGCAHPSETEARGRI